MKLRTKQMISRGTILTLAVTVLLSVGGSYLTTTRAVVNTATKVNTVEQTVYDNSEDISQMKPELAALKVKVNSNTEAITKLAETVEQAVLENKAINASMGQSIIELNRVSNKLVDANEDLQATVARLDERTKDM